jgi:N-acetylglucosaminyldiphosphoundecaprenol N-acetyl-beta-D-mannosaminyltransferase
MLRKIEILSVPFTAGSQKEILEEVKGWLSEKRFGRYIVTPNPEMIVRATEDKEFKKVLDSSDLSLADGVGVTFAAQILGKHGLSRVTGVDFMEALCCLASDMSSKDVKNPVTVGFLGGRPGVAERTGECLRKKHPDLRIVFVGQEWGEEGFGKAEETFSPRGPVSLHPRPTSSVASLPVGDRRGAPALATPPLDILFVAFGFPKQEVWMFEHREKIEVKVMMGVGGAFDYISGEVKRAPKLMRDLGLEWLFRLVSQPWRFKRQLALPHFLLLILKRRFS